MSEYMGHRYFIVRWIRRTEVATGELPQSRLTMRGVEKRGREEEEEKSRSGVPL